MSAATPDAVRAFVIAALDQPLRDTGMSPADVTDDLDLIRGGLVDSLGFLELITTVEAHFDLEIDFEELDAEELTVLGSFTRFVAEQSEEAAAA